MIGVALGLLLVFRTNASFDRWWEGRKLLGGIVNRTRDMARQLYGYAAGSPETLAVSTTIVRHLDAFFALATQGLRAEDQLDKVLSLTPSERALLTTKKARASVVLSWVTRAVDDLGKRVAWAVAFGALGLALSSFFWAPALLETSAIQLSAITGPAGYDFRGNFLSLDTLLAGPFTYDPHRVLTPMPTAIGRGALACAALGLLSLLPGLAKRAATPDSPTRVGRSLLLLGLGSACVIMRLRVIPRRSASIRFGSPSCPRTPRSTEDERAPCQTGTHE